MSNNILIIGCGLSGVTIAERFANLKNKKVLIIDKREHVGGNVYDYIDQETNILISKYGAHLFHTNNERVYNYISSFDKWIRYDYKFNNHNYSTIKNLNNNIFHLLYLIYM